MRIDLPVLAQSSRWAIVSKPSGLPVHRSALVRSGPTLVGVAGRQLGCRVDPVHRLDQPTSGCLLLSLDREHTGALQLALAAGQKRYVALVRGCIPTRDAYLEARPLAVDGIERDASTLLQPVASSRDPRCSLVLATPSTGRFHQIRRHLRGLDHPVIGDSTHGDTRVNKAWREHGLHRLALHCFELTMELDGELVTVNAPLPPELATVFRAMPWWDEAVATLPALDERAPEAAA